MMTTINDSRRADREHGGFGAMIPSGCGTSSGRDPLAEDHLAAATALALDMATTQVKQLAHAGAISPQRASAWRTEGKGNPVYDLSLVVYHLTLMGEHPGAILAQVHTAMLQALLGISDAELVRRFWKALDQECHKEGAENAATAAFARTGDLRGLARAMRGEAGLQHEIAAYAEELDRRGIDPRTYGPGN
jgi:hypothetical protein